MLPSSSTGIPFTQALQLILFALCLVVFTILKWGSSLHYHPNWLLRPIGWVCWIFYKPFAEIAVGFHEQNRKRAVEDLNDQRRCSRISSGMGFSHFVFTGHQGGGTIPKRVPEKKVKLAIALFVGYQGSALVGALLIFASFDMRACKIAFVLFLPFFAFCIIQAVWLQLWPDSNPLHSCERRRALFKFSLRKRADTNNQQASRSPDDLEKTQCEMQNAEQNTRQNRMITLAVVTLCATFAFIMLFLSWFFANSLWLKIYLLFWGAMTGVYSLLDIYDDMSEDESDFAKLSKYVTGDAFTARQWGLVSLFSASLVLVTFLLAALAAFDRGVKDQIDVALTFPRKWDTSHLEGDLLALQHRMGLDLHTEFAR